MTTVREVMTASAAAIDGGTTMAEAAARMAEHRVGALPIIDRDGQACGMLTGRDIVLTYSAGGSDPYLITAVRCAEGPPAAIDEGARVEHAAEVMANNRVGRLLVYSGDVVVGTVCRVDLAVGMRADEFGMVMRQRLTEPEGLCPELVLDAEPVGARPFFTHFGNRVASVSPDRQHAAASTR